MSQEILYTSAPKGLKPGSRGFCTVVSTPGMSSLLAEKLESLSGYKHLYMPHDPMAHQNPVAWSHFRLAIGGRSLNLLSRISDFRVDYSGRSNKLAHHIIVDACERCAGGPAWVLSQAGFMQTDWDQEVRILTRGRSIPAGDPGPEVCREWEQLTGDAGWAGIVAQSHLDDPNRLVYLIYRPGMDLLPLIREAIALLPPDRRWDVTFSTYFTSLPPDVKCSWRCVLKDSAEENNSRRFPTALRVDLTSVAGSPPPGPLVDLARTGAFSEASSESNASLLEVAESATHLQSELEDTDAALPSKSTDHALAVESELVTFPPALHGTYALDGNRPTPPRLSPPDIRRPPKLKRTARPRSGYFFAALISLCLFIGIVGWAWHRAKQNTSLESRESSVVEDAATTDATAIGNSRRAEPELSVAADTNQDGRADPDSKDTPSNEAGASSSEDISVALSNAKAMSSEPIKQPVKQPGGDAKEASNGLTATNSTAADEPRTVGIDPDKIELAYIGLADTESSDQQESFPWPLSASVPRKLQILQPTSRRPLQLKCELQNDPGQDAESVAFSIFGQDQVIATLTFSLMAMPGGQSRRMAVNVRWSSGLNSASNQECVRAGVLRFPDVGAACTVALAKPIETKAPSSGCSFEFDYYRQYKRRQDKSDLKHCVDFFPSEIVVGLKGERYQFDTQKQEQSTIVASSEAFTSAILDHRYDGTAFLSQFKMQNGRISDSIQKMSVEMPQFRAAHELEDMNPGILFSCSSGGEIRLHGHMAAKLKIPKEGDSDELSVPLAWRSAGQAEISGAKRKINRRRSPVEALKNIEKVLATNAHDKKLSDKAIENIQRSLSHAYQGLAAEHDYAHIVTSLQEARLLHCIIRERVGSVLVDRIRISDEY